MIKQELKEDIRVCITLLERLQAKDVEKISYEEIKRVRILIQDLLKRHEISPYKQLQKEDKD